MTSPQINILGNKSLTFTVYDTKWIPSSSRFVVLGSHARGIGVIQIYEMQKNELVLRSENDKQSPFKCGTFGATSLEERHLATGDMNGRISTWDLQRPESSVWTSKGHEQMIYCIDGIGGIKGGGAPEIVAGSRDGKVSVWDVRTTNPVLKLDPAPSSYTNNVPSDCWTVCFGNSYDQNRVLGAGFANGDVKLFDLRTSKTLWMTNVGKGVCNMEFDRSDIEMNKLVVTTLGATFRVYDMRTRGESSDTFAHVQHSAHESTIWNVKHLPQNREVWATTGGDGKINLWKYEYPAQRKIKTKEGKEEGVAGTVRSLTSLEISTQPVLAFDWNQDKEGLFVTSALDQSVKVGAVTRLSTVK
eukprot:TRINITY_DN4643_c0_g1_i1.p1 TRINITY_DN4643_c0_g1~~TRINITY_DN4643_c0_g1_i1.p1  ORF type:complete len:369 (+),score=104.39 TRINITY_DN4643_c0_g1_i1:35-1108(+)